MKKILLGALFIFLTCNAKKTEEPIMVGGPGTTTPLWCMENEGPQRFLKSFPDGSNVYFCTTVNGKTRYLAAIKDESSGLYHLGLQEKPVSMVIKHSGTEAITLKLPEPFDPQEKSWAAGPWLAWADSDEAPKNSGAYSDFCKTLKQGEGFLNEDDKGRLVLPAEFASRATTLKFWCTATEPAATKEFTFKELTNGKVVTLQVENKYLHRTMVDLPIPRGVRTLIAPKRETLSLEDTSQPFEIQSNQIGVFFMPVDTNKPGTRTAPGFGPFKIIPVDQKSPSLKQVYLQNALDPTTPQYIQIDAQGTDNRNATLGNATTFCIKVE